MLSRIKKIIPKTKTKIGSKESTAPDSITDAPVIVGLYKNATPRVATTIKVTNKPILCLLRTLGLNMGLNMFIAK